MRGKSEPKVYKLGLGQRIFSKPLEKQVISLKRRKTDILKEEIGQHFTAMWGMKWRPGAINASNVVVPKLNGKLKRG